MLFFAIREATRRAPPGRCPGDANGPRQSDLFRPAKKSPGGHCRHKHALRRQALPKGSTTRPASPSASALAAAPPCGWPRAPAPARASSWKFLAEAKLQRPWKSKVSVFCLRRKGPCGSSASEPRASGSSVAAAWRARSLRNKSRRSKEWHGGMAAWPATSSLPLHLPTRKRRKRPPLFIADTSILHRSLSRSQGSGQRPTPSAL